MKKTVPLILILSLAIIAAAGIMTVTVTAIPQIPESYWGYAILNDDPAPIGTKVTVEVYSTGEVVGSYTIQYEAGVYVMEVRIDDPASPKDEGAENGEPLTWKLNGIECSTPAPGADTAESGKINDNFTIVASSPAITNATDKNNAAKINGKNKSLDRLATDVTPHPHRPGPGPGPSLAPEFYWGYAALNDAPVASGTPITVEVYGTGEIVGNTTVADTNGLYSLDVYICNRDNPDDGFAINRDPLTWRINGIICSIPAAGTDTAVVGEANDDFNITASCPSTPISVPKFSWILLFASAFVCIVALVIIAVIVKKKSNFKYTKGLIIFCDMKKIGIVIIVLLIMIGTATVVVAQPKNPEFYLGYATLDDIPPPINTSITVEVYGTGEVVGENVTLDDNGLYGLFVYISSDNYPNDGYALNGDNLTWKIDEIECSFPPAGKDTADEGCDYCYLGEDHSGEYFNITAHPNPPAPTVLKPNGGEEIPGDSIYDVKWNVTNGTYDLAANPITIYNSTDSGDSWNQIVTGEVNDGVYSWNVPNIGSSNCLIKVEAIDEYGITGNDTSDSTFTVLQVANSTNKTISAGETETVEGPPESNTTVNVTASGDVTITVSSYSTNPHPEAPEPANMMPKYIDISVSEKDNVTWPMYVEMHYTDEEIAGLDESILRFYYYEAGAWHGCSDTGVKVDENYVWAYVAEDECAGSPFVTGESALPPPPPVAVPEYNVIGLLALIGILTIILAFATSRRKKE